MSAFLRNQRRICKRSTSMVMKFQYPVNFRRYLSSKAQFNNYAAKFATAHHANNNTSNNNPTNNTRRLCQCDSLLHTSSSSNMNRFTSPFAENPILKWQPNFPNAFNFSNIRNFHLGQVLNETPSSKVEATVQTMKKQQKEKVDEMMKEVSNNAAKAAAAEAAETTSSSKTFTDSSSATATAAASKKSTAAAASAVTDKSSTTTAKQTAADSAENVLSTKPQDFKPMVVKKSLKTRIWEELVHYYHGFRLLFVDINICRKLLWRVLNGKTLTRRENRLLVRTTSDLFRLIPFSVFIIVPFMELLLPLFIKFFPGMLPSTFQTSKEREDKLKQSLQVKLEMAKFLQKTLDEMAVQHKEHKSEEAKQFANFFRRIKNPNEYVSKDEIIKYASRFKDEITLDSLSREQLAALCRLLELNTMGTSAFLRFQLRMKLRSLAADDRVIAREGVQSLDLYELQQACKARGMRAYGLTTERLHAQLQEWIDLSLNEKVPPVLLLLSRAIFISDEHTTADKLKETIRVLPDSVAAQTKAAIGELEGKIDNKTKIEVIKEEERKIKEERDEEREEEKAKETEAKEMLLDKAPTISVDAPATVAAKREAAAAAAEMGMGAECGDAQQTIGGAYARATAATGATTSADASATATTSTIKQTSTPADDDKKISSKDVELLSEALKTLSSGNKKLIVEKEQLKDIKEELEDYKEDVEELHEVRNVVKEPVTESRAAKLLFKKVNKMIGQLDKVLDDLEKKQKEIQQQNEPEAQTAEDAAIQRREQESVRVAELMQAIRKVQQTSTESRLDQIENVLSKLDADKDGVVTVNEVINVIEAIGRENIKLDEKQIEEVITLLDKEQMIQAEEKIEKALAKSIKESDAIKAKNKLKEQRRMEAEQAAACLEELKDKAPELKDNAVDLELEKGETLNQEGLCTPQANIRLPGSATDVEEQISTQTTTSSQANTKKSTASVLHSTQASTTPTPPPSATSSSTNTNTKDKML